MTRSDKLREAELREAAAPLAILHILAKVRPQLRAQIVKCVQLLVEADAIRPGLVERFAGNGHPAVQESHE